MLEEIGIGLEFPDPIGAVEREIVGHLHALLINQGSVVRVDKPDGVAARDPEHSVREFGRIGGADTRFVVDPINARRRGEPGRCLR